MELRLDIQTIADLETMGHVTIRDDAVRIAKDVFERKGKVSVSQRKGETPFREFTSADGLDELSSLLHPNKPKSQQEELNRAMGQVDMARTGVEDTLKMAHTL